MIKKHMRNRVGFSLIELIVVISIIALLSGIGISSFSAAQRKARDTKRKGDLSEISKAMEQYYGVCGNRYPIPTLSSYPGIVCPSTPAIPILPTSPRDPYLTPYVCSSGCNAGSYRLCADLETETADYCVTNRQ